ncbi:predicted protein [Phaeodactylum tricornutum CCAP 1055/1]|jgi:predicted dehydrogenase|uniref:Gfo/Idh/MocA-like oxidoreductase N-terminal domain-containing protein n=1 Tax=Phaeodactylum tricornutum (strain CCAP 1055/1) TaxID=556484 RepID=B5Y4E2_PHATC|nr:predicted protein [Phaeodactylum tricornutum CCAP 1055/1]ACI65466.1 predicted protein [Phaeodactylum tricornutum CCAP 1055/1]|eukprot:XP_002185996.1 predicted protein [Phaeodactylum tricornutum CCAP 1055/1]
MNSTLPATDSDHPHVSVIVVGSGAPLQSMGWYHAVQLLDGRIPSAQLDHVVEPWWTCDEARGTLEYTAFADWQQTLQQRPGGGVQCWSHVADVPESTTPNVPRLVILSARTSENPRLLAECLRHLDCRAIFLEKPGAPTVRELQLMQTQAAAAGVKVYLGFNKNVSAYLTQTRLFAEHADEPVDVTFLHNNAYPNEPAALAECFERNAEGMLKNMAIHELAILATFYDVTVDNIASVHVDREFSLCQTLIGPSTGQSYTDFVKLRFRIVTWNGKSASIAADRCGGDDSVGIVTNSHATELARFIMPDADALAQIPMLAARYPGARPYFFTQDPDYRTLKERVVQYCLDGTPPHGVADLDIAITALQLAEYLTPILQAQLAESSA